MIKRMKVSAKYTPSAHVRRRIEHGANRPPKKSLSAHSFGTLSKRMEPYFPPFTPEFGSQKVMLRVGVHGEGTCFFHTIRAAIDAQSYLERNTIEQRKIGQKFRRSLIARVDSTWLPFWKSKNWPAEKIPSIEKTKKDLADVHEWADTFTIIWTVQHILKLNIIVFNITDGRIFCGTHLSGTKRPTILMAWVDHAHFELLAQWDRKKKTLRTMFAHDHPTMKHVLAMHQRQPHCPLTTLHDILDRQHAENMRKKRKKAAS